ncbi:uncharacterized protein LOC143904035 isoform X1 [Temnothorax americanus]|uniref:uncharacterized protein LOC143904035 isoform X1 n=3 Tax=Temnothorax americanus TaxID=1964332 RepID=UPI004067B6C9
MHPYWNFCRRRDTRNFRLTVQNVMDMAMEVRNKRILHWSCRGLAELPEVIRLYGGHVKEIYLKWNELTTLPPWIAELYNMTNLYLYNNRIERLPVELGEMSQLTVLDLSTNRLQLVPACIGNLKNLRYLSLDNNLIERLSVELSQLNNLEVLSISGNQIVTLPEWIGSFPRLRELYVDGNRLRELPNRLTIAPNLTLISACENRLTYLPLNGFLSAPYIRVEGNEYLNYISYPLLQQLYPHLRHSLIFYKDVCKDVTSRYFKTHYDTNGLSIKLHIKTKDFFPINYDATIELPRQLLKVHEVHENVTCSLLELALRKVYTERYKHTLDIPVLSEKGKVTVFYEPLLKNTKLDFILSTNHILYSLSTNGPTSICVNSQCQQPIFTEAWIIIDMCNPTVWRTITIALCCSRSCAIAFAHSNATDNPDCHCIN